jgi:protoporphyrinogen/coproporphyrinogen III oxidase
MKRIAVIGGGISGLAAAFALEKERRKGAELEFAVFESSSRFGGVIHSERVDGCLVEAGPDSFLSEKPWATDLCRELGLADQLIGSNDAERKTHILVNGRLVPIPDGMMFMVPTRLTSVLFSPLFSWRTKWRIQREWFYRSSSESSDITVAEFVRRHYGREMVEHLADPLLAGVYGGNADEMSVKSVLPRFIEMEASHGSLGKAVLARRKARPSGNAPLFTSLRDGMQQLTDALLKQLSPANLRPETRVQAVKPESRKWQVIYDGRTQAFDGVILSLPAHVAAAILSGLPEFSSELNAIRYSSSAIVVLAHDESVRAKLPPGFGFLVPRGENRRLIAATFVHNKFPDRAPRNRALIRCFLGGTRDPAVLELSDGELENLVRGEIAQILGITAIPLFTRVYKWSSAMAQYDVGHSERISRIRALIAQSSGLALAGNAYAGIGVPDCVRSGSEAAAKVMADIGICGGGVADD